MPDTVSQPTRILIIKLGAFGDFIQALGPIAAIRGHHPDAEITLLTTKPFKDLADMCPYIDRVLIDEKPKFGDIKAWLQLRKTLNAGRYERIYDLQNNDRTSIYFKLLAHPKPEWVGAARGASHRNASKARTAGHAIEGHRQTLAGAGISDIPVDTLEWLDAPLETFALITPYILLVPGCAPARPEKRWPPEKYGRLAQMLASAGYQPVILGTQNESGAAAIIQNMCPQALNLINQTDFTHITALARGAAGAVGNDTGPMHLIGVTNCPSLVLFSAASNPLRHAPLGAHVSILQKMDLNALTPEDVIGQFKPREDFTAALATKH